MNHYSPSIPNRNTGPYVVCIGRELGSGGRQIGKILAERLALTYYDSEILSLAAEHSGLRRDIFARSDEHKGFLRHVLGSFTPVVGGEDFYDSQLSAEHLFEVQSQAIRKAASEHACVFIGRAADYVLRQHPRCISVFVSANVQDRISRIMEAEHVNAHTAQRMVEIGDRKRADFYNFYAQGTWGAASTYNLLVNSSTLGIEKTAEFIIDYAKAALKL